MSNDAHREGETEEQNGAAEWCSCGKPWCYRAGSQISNKPGPKLPRNVGDLIESFLSFLLLPCLSAPGSPPLCTMSPALLVFFWIAFYLFFVLSHTINCDQWHYRKIGMYSMYSIHKTQNSHVGVPTGDPSLIVWHS